MPHTRPVVVIGMDGGLIQWEMSAAGVGMPEVFALDFDREGTPYDEWEWFIERIEAAITALEGHDLPAKAPPDEADLSGLAVLKQTLTEVCRTAHEVAQAEDFEFGGEES